MAAVELGPIADVGILGGGVAFPERELTNLEVLQYLAPSLWAGRSKPPDEAELRFVAQSLEQTMGVQRRRWSHLPGTLIDHAKSANTLDLSIIASGAALADAGVKAADVSLVLSATSTPHRMTSTLSAQIATALGITGAAIDTRTGCSGGLFALATGALFAQAGAGVVLLVGADTFSKVIPPQSKLAALSLGDGAGALVLGPRQGSRLDSVFLRTDGSLGKLITTDGALPPTHEEIDRGGYLLSGAPEELTAVIPGKYEEAIGHALRRAGLLASQVDLYVPHQTSRGVISSVASRVGIAAERTFVNVEHHANIGAAGWMVALVEARSRLRPGDRVLTAAVGGGMSWASAVLTW